MLKHFWDNESIGIHEPPEGEQSTQFLPEIQLMVQDMKLGFHGKRIIPALISQMTFIYALTA